MGKADHHRKVGTAHPQQSQNDKAGHRHGADELHGRAEKDPNPPPACSRRSQKQPAHQRQHKAGEDAQGAESDTVPEFGGGKLHDQGLQRLHRGGEKQPAMAQRHGRQLPHHHPEDHRGRGMPAGRAGRIPKIRRHSRSHRQAGHRLRWKDRRRTGPGSRFPGRCASHRR